MEQVDFPEEPFDFQRLQRILTIERLLERIPTMTKIDIAKLALAKKLPTAIISDHCGVVRLYKITSLISKKNLKENVMNDLRMLL